MATRHRQGRRSELRQLIYVTGLLEGYSYGALDLETEVVIDGGSKACSDLVAKTSQPIHRYIENVTTGQVWEGLNEFYKDYRNRSIRASIALSLVLRSINGENIDSLVLGYRRSAGK